MFVYPQRYAGNLHIRAAWSSAGQLLLDRGRSRSFPEECYRLVQSPCDASMERRPGFSSVSARRFHDHWPVPRAKIVVRLI